MSATRPWFKLGTLLTLALPLFLGISGCSDDEEEGGDDETAKMAMEVEVTIVPKETDEASDEEATESSSEALATTEVSEEPAKGADE
jgi:hypothetical protein